MYNEDRWIPYLPVMLSSSESVIGDKAGQPAIWTIKADEDTALLACLSSVSCALFWDTTDLFHNSENSMVSSNSNHY